MPLKPIYALVGNDAFLQLQFLADIVRQAGKGAQRIDIDGERAELSEVLDEVRCFAMFGGTKVVVVQMADAFITKYRESLEDYALKPSDSAVLVLRLASLPANQRIYKAISKTGVIEKCEPPKDLAKWIIDRGKAAHQLTVGVDAAKLLADYVGDDLARLDNELAKLALAVDDGKVKATDIAAGVAFQREMELSEMVNAVAAGRPADAVLRWRRLLVSDSSVEFRAVAWLVIWLTNTRKALAMKRQGMNAFAITSALRIWPREMQQPFMETVNQLGERGAAKAIDLLAEIDKQSKSGVGDAAENVERFLLSIGGMGVSPMSK
jgi:DNA polymerase-3 subunit delta